MSTSSYHVTDEHIRARWSTDPKIRAECSRIEAKSRLCHEILGHAKRGDTEAIFRLFETSGVDLTTVYPRFSFQAWLDTGGGFMAKNVTIFQAALLKPESYTQKRHDQFDGKHTGESFATLLKFIDEYKIGKSVLRHQDQAGRTILHTLVSTYNPEQAVRIERLLLDSLADEPAIKEELWGTRDKWGKLYDEVLLLKSSATKSTSSNCLPPTKLQTLLGEKRKIHVIDDDKKNKNFHLTVPRWTHTLYVVFKSFVVCVITFLVSFFQQSNRTS